MRVLAIGLGGAGSRIVDQLYDHDQRSRVYCMSAVAIDIDPNSLLQLRHLPNPARIFFPRVDILDHAHVTDVIDIEEVMTRLQSMDTMEIDAILLCCGLGGSVIDIAPLIIAEIRKSYVEPIFALAVLPCLEEGKRVSAKAADDLDALQGLVDAVILFDNETWSQKIKAAAAAAGTENTSVMDQLRQIPTGSDPRTHYNMLNERIARQIGLLLRAGEFNESGLDVAEVVLDAGEVLNTLKGNGFVAVGYATERLPTGWLNIFHRRQSLKDFIQGSQEKAARIISLAKKAVYEDVSVPCDLTSADKALVLIAGPSAELSMKGFQTVRKWIDRSIAGLEMRSGDYPVKSTSFVGIIIVLSGLTNIPRVEELRDIRTEYQLECEEERLRGEEEARLREEEEGLAAGAVSEVPDDAGVPGFASPLESAYLEEIGYMAEPTTPEKDEMISLPGSGGSDRKRRDDTIVMLPKAEKKQDDGVVVLPPKPGGKEIDLTGSASVTSSVPAPKNSTFGLKGIAIEKTGPKDDAVTYSTSLKPVQRPKDGSLSADAGTLDHGMQRPKDGVFTGDHVTLGQGMQRPKDSLFEEAGLHMREGAPLPKDDSLGQIGRGFARPGPRPKEVDPSRGKLEVIDAAARQKNRDEEKRSDDDTDGGITWL
ncbi:cell division protein FtsZ [Methanoculleus chikugoensis]|uniref:Tubulin-like protein CetZ n=1 Tax=Methanoculleus chikugoensis TaxID=118126 RepID=A0A1M4MNP1_9EURY|nr:tubulin/FtsZ family protein [Methanoculleus chikugoensis]MDD4566769.1 tubulin/FtsZ family protein [Methanoculleus chikugoensis]NMA10208.1 cell division protein [Methanomicrobiales archaeon]SCL76477.1 cell division protein FtsZ [Methanoculleus chikugoensis]